MPSPRQHAVSLARFALAGVLLLVIFHVIFCNEAQLHLAALGGNWESLTRWEQRRLAWSRGPVELWATVRRLDPASLATAFLLCGVPIVVGGLRWRAVLQVQGLHLSLREVIRLSFIAHFFNAFLLGSTGGDFVKAWYAARHTEDRRAEAALTVFVDRLLGTLALLAFAVAMAPVAWEIAADGQSIHPLRDYRRYQAVLVTVAGLLLVAGGLMGVGFYTDLLRHDSLLGRAFRRLPAGDSIARALAACRQFGRHPGFIRQTSLWSLVVNLSIVGTFLALAHGLKLQVPDRLLWFVVPAVICVAALPVAPSGLGVRENLFVALLTLPALPAVKPAEALSLSLLGYTANLAWSAVGGAIYLLSPPAGPTPTPPPA
ncbi:MAG: lysylphosphatidylglycerol synthase transmembrane domain-containing protein [Verrucomicrobiota bacterium]